MNYMEVVAQILGVDIGEEFDIKDDKDKIAFRKYHLTQFGLCKILDDGCDGDYADDILVRLLNGCFKVYQPVLNTAEKEYLDNVIKPFRDKIIYISKLKAGYRSGIGYISITTEDNGWKHYAELPLFGGDSMYKGMEMGKEYSLEDLGL